MGWWADVDAMRAIRATELELDDDDDEDDEHEEDNDAFVGVVVAVVVVTWRSNWSASCGWVCDEALFILYNVQLQFNSDSWSFR